MSKVLLVLYPESGVEEGANGGNFFAAIDTRSGKIVDLREEGGFETGATYRVINEDGVQVGSVRTLRKVD